MRALFALLNGVAIFIAIAAILMPPSVQFELEHRFALEHLFSLEKLSPAGRGGGGPGPRGSRQGKGDGGGRQGGGAYQLGRTEHK